MAPEDPVSLFVTRLAGFRVPGPYQDKLRNPYSDPRRRENLRLQQENTVLKKAVAIFAHPSVSGTASSRSTDD